MANKEKKQLVKTPDCRDVACGIVIFDIKDGLKLLYANEEYKRIFAYNGDVFLNVYGEDVCLLCDRIQSGKSNFAEYRYIDKNGEIGFAYMVFRENSDGIFDGAVFDISDYRTRYKRFEKILRSDKIIFAEIDLKADVCHLLSGEGASEIVINDFSQNATKYGFDDKEDVKKILDTKTSDESCVIRYRRTESSDLKYYMLYKSVINGKDGEPEKIVASLCNVDREKQNEQKLISKMEIDPLTKVYNRESAKEKIEQYLAANKDKKNYALFVLDLDNFKIINDTFGHLYGDAVLSMAAGCIKSSVGSEDIVGRFGGDEFFVFVKDSEADVIIEKAQKIIKTILSMRKNISDDNDISCSLGVAHGEDGSTYEELFKMADIALYRSKNSGKNCITVYTSDMSGDAGGAIDYEPRQDDNENKTKSHDLTHMAIEIAARSTSLQNAVHMIMRNMGLELDIDDVKIMRVNFEEDIISIEHHWSKLENVAERDNRTGYYLHDDIVALRSKFEQKPLFAIKEDVKEGFSEKFAKELSKLAEKSVIYSSHLTKDSSFFYIVLSCFKPDREWDEKTLNTIAEITKVLFVYLMKNYKGKVAPDNDPFSIEPHTKLLYIDKFHEQAGNIRKLAVENNQSVVLVHTDFHHLREFNRIYGVRATESIIIDYAASINRNNRNRENICIATHIYGTDKFVTLMRSDSDIESIAYQVMQFNRNFCGKKLKKYPEFQLIAKSGICLVKDGEDLWRKIDEAYELKQTGEELDKCTFYLSDK